MNKRTKKQVTNEDLARMINAGFEKTATKKELKAVRNDIRAEMTTELG